MSNLPINIHFDFEGYYSLNTAEDEYQWHPREASLYGISFKTLSLVEITYSVIVDRICRKIKIDESTTKLKLSYIPLVAKGSRPSYISDDDDVYVYLTTMDEKRRRCVLHVETISDLEVVPLCEQLSRVEKRSSFGRNYGEMISSDRDNDIVNVGVVTIYAGGEPPKQPHEPMEQLENVVTGDMDNDIDININNGGENDVDMGMGSSEIREYVELPHVVQKPKYKDAWEDGIGIEIGQEFESKQEVQDLIDKASHLQCFGVVIANSDTNRYVVKCSESVDGCKWYLLVAKLKNSTRFSVRVYTKMHTCSRTNSSTSYKRKGTPRLVASLLQEDYPGQFETPTPKSLISLVQGKLGVPVSYSTAYRGKMLAVSDVRGSPEESFKMIYSYVYMLEKVNPGTKTSVVLDEKKRFKYLYVALGARIEGFQAMRKVIIVDATFLKTVHGGVLIFATVQDPNHHHYPIAFAVVDGEKDASWTWFFNPLKTIIPGSPELVFISDRNASLIKAVGEVYPSSHHGYCIFHLSQNVRAKVTYAKKDVVAEKFREIARIYTVAEFEQQYEDYRRRYPTVAAYLDTTVEVKKWARCYFPGVKYNIDTSNTVESMNSVFAKARKYALLPMIDAIVIKLEEWFNSHRKDSVAVSNAHKLVPFVENEMHNRCEVAAKLTSFELNTFQLEYDVIGRDGKTYVVDLRNKSCSCRYFDIDKYPCIHAIAAAKKFWANQNKTMEVRDLYELCTKYYLVELWALAYVRTIYPVPHMSEWSIPSEIQELYALPPNYTKRKERIQETRKPSVGERRRKHKQVPGRNLASWFHSEGGSQDQSQD